MPTIHARRTPALAYALGAEFDGGVRRLFRMGIGLLLASHAVQIMNFLFG